jgi:hypothetical protein
MRAELIARLNDIAADHRTSSCHGIVGSDGTRRRMTRGRATVAGFGFGDFAGFGSGGLPKVRCGFTSRAPVPPTSLKRGAAYLLYAAARRQRSGQQQSATPRPR